MIEGEEEFEKRDREIIENAETQLEETYEKKDMKEKRGYIKNHFYAGSKKKKHKVVKKGA